VVGSEDTVYYLGDFTLKGGKVALKYIDRLVGRIKFVPGGHDVRWLKDLGINVKAGDTGPLPRPYHKHEVLPMVYFQNVRIPDGAGAMKKQLIVLCHYPFFTWEASHHGSWNLHGHSHGGLGKANRYLKIIKSPPTTLEDGHSIDVGVDAGWDFYPVHFETIVGRLG
jgi:calcineurin-like phosphoesterase family protein